MLFHFHSTPLLRIHTQNIYKVYTTSVLWAVWNMCGDEAQLFLSFFSVSRSHSLREEREREREKKESLAKKIRGPSRWGIVLASLISIVSFSDSLMGS